MASEFKSVTVAKIGGFSVEIEAKMMEDSEVGAALTAPNQAAATGGSEDMATSTTKRTTSPAFQFYPKDFLSSSRVQRMSLTEVGVYIVLLSHVWLAGGLPTDVTEIAKIVKVQPPRFKRMWAGALSECFVKRGSVLVNERLDRERKKQHAFREKQAEFGRKGGRRVALPEPTGEPSSTLKGAGSPRGHSHYGESKQQRDSSVVLEKEERLDVAFVAFREAYPSHRRKGGFLIEQSFVACAHKAGGASRLMAALANHIASDQWSNQRLIPGMDTWLAEERWRQELPAAGAATSSANNPKTAGNIPALQRFIDRGKTA